MLVFAIVLLLATAIGPERVCHVEPTNGHPIHDLVQYLERPVRTAVADGRTDSECYPRMAFALAVGSIALAGVCAAIAWVLLAPRHEVDRERARG